MLGGTDRKLRGLVDVEPAERGFSLTENFPLERLEPHFVTIYTCITQGRSIARGRKTSLTIHLTPVERQTLLAWQGATTVSAGRARRGRIILLVAEWSPDHRSTRNITSPGRGLSNRLVCMCSMARGDGYLAFKMNALVDKGCIQALYRASQAGVKVDLQVRRICRLRPGVSGVSEHMTVTSIVGRFLAHTRIYYFRNGGQDEVLLCSAALMPRNLDRRVEILFPVEEPCLRQTILHDILGLHLQDNAQARRLLSTAPMNVSGLRLARRRSIHRHGCSNTGKTEEGKMKTTHKTDATRKARRLAPLSLCVAQTALHYLHALVAEMDGVRQTEDRECVHRMRVASRRLRSVLPLLAPALSRQTCVRWRKQLRRVTRVLGVVRDTDVQMACVQQFLYDSASAEERAGVERLLLRLEQRRQTLQEPVVKALERFAARQLVKEMGEHLNQVVSQSASYGIDVPGRRVYRQTRTGILKRLNAFEAYAPYVAQPSASRNYTPCASPPSACATSCKRWRRSTRRGWQSRYRPRACARQSWVTSTIATCGSTPCCAFWKKNRRAHWCILGARLPSNRYDRAFSPCSTIASNSGHRTTRNL